MTSIPHFHGHRQRLRERLLKSPQGSLPDYEILELLLCLTNTRKDVKPLAKTLLSNYGNLTGVLNATPDMLLSIPGVGSSILSTFRVVKEIATRLLKEEISTKPIIASWESLLNYFRTSIGFSKSEHFRVLFLDKKNMIIADEIQEKGTIDHVHIYPREIMKRALFLEASSIILVHNHPSGITQPSPADISITKQIITCASLLGIDVHDHIIIGQGNHYSFRSHGLIGKHYD